MEARLLDIHKTFFYALLSFTCDHGLHVLAGFLTPMEEAIPIGCTLVSALLDSAIMRTFEGSGQCLVLVFTTHRKVLLAPKNICK